MVEPVAGVLGAFLVVYVERILPYALSFAAGAMILVAVHELIPECQKSRESHPYFSTMGIISGFAVMMLLDVMIASIKLIIHPRGNFVYKKAVKKSASKRTFLKLFYYNAFACHLGRFFHTHNVEHCGSKVCKTTFAELHIAHTCED